MEVTEKEFAVINEIHKNEMPDQRMIANRTGISLGLTNLIIKRLIKQGYIKARQLNRKKIEYMLTPMGFSEKTKKTYNFTLKTVNHLTHIKDSIKKLINECTENGYTDFELSGNGDLLEIVQLAFNSITGKKIRCVVKKPSVAANNSGILTSIKSIGGERVSYDIMDYLAKTGLYYW